MPAKRTTEEAAKPRSRRKAAEPPEPEAAPLLKDRRFVGALIVLAAVAVFAGGYFVGHAAGSEADGAAADQPLVIDRDAYGPGFLGVVGTDAPRRWGALIVEVLPGSPADRAGLEHGDLVVSVAGREIVSMRELAHLIHRTAPGTAVEVGVIRGDHRVAITVVVGSQADQPEAGPRRLPFRPPR